MVSWLPAIFCVLAFLAFATFLSVNRKKFDNDNLFKAAQIFGSIGSAILISAGLFWGLNFNSVEKGYFEMSPAYLNMAVFLTMIGVVFCFIALWMALTVLTKDFERNNEK